MKKMDKGFTLIELMIVVAIIGILAAVAVPGFMQYIKSSKTAEAMDNLNAIVKGAQTYYEAEHCYTSDCLKPVNGLYPGELDLSTIGAKTAYVAASKASLLKAQADPGVKTSPADIVATLKKEPWHSLKLQINQPFYYNYHYKSTGDEAKSNDVTFNAAAEASLKEKFDSTFEVAGTNGQTGNIVDKSTDGATKSQVSF